MPPPSPFCAGLPDRKTVGTNRNREQTKTVRAANPNPIFLLPEDEKGRGCLFS
jgi:hypothetical protein